MCTEDKESNLKKASKYWHLNWTQEEENLLLGCFGIFDEIMYLCEKSNNVEKMEALCDIHEKLHLLSLSIEQ